MEKPPITFVCHLDTVPNAVGVKTIIEDGVIHSDSTTALGVDDKIAVALALLLVEEKQLYGPIGVLFTVGSHALGFILARAATASVCL